MLRIMRKMLLDRTLQLCGAAMGGLIGYGIAVSLAQGTAIACTLAGAAIGVLLSAPFDLSGRISREERGE